MGPSTTRGWGMSREKFCCICKSPKKTWHLVCGSCWSQVPEEKQEKVYHLYKTKKGSSEHRNLCLEIIGDLSREQYKRKKQLEESK